MGAVTSKVVMLAASDPAALVPTLPTDLHRFPERPSRMLPCPCPVSALFGADQPLPGAVLLQGSNADILCQLPPPSLHHIWCCPVSDPVSAGILDAIPLYEVICQC
jgi:hypothetical protein